MKIFIEWPLDHMGIAKQLFSWGSLAIYSFTELNASWLKTPGIAKEKVLEPIKENEQKILYAG